MTGASGYDMRIGQFADPLIPVSLPNAYRSRSGSRVRARAFTRRTEISNGAVGIRSHFSSAGQNTGEDEAIEERITKRLYAPLHSRLLGSQHHMGTGII